MSNWWKSFLYFSAINFIQFGIDFFYISNISSIQSLIYYNWKESTEFLHGINTTDLSLTIFTGIFTQLIIGSWSDKCSNKWGKRRIFMAIGTIIAIVFQLLSFVLLFVPLSEIQSAFSNSTNSTTLSEEGSMKKTIFFILFILTRFTSIGLNMIQVGYRAFILDEFDSEFQLQVYTLSTVNTAGSKFFHSILYVIIAAIVSGIYGSDNPAETSNSSEGLHSEAFNNKEGMIPYYFFPIQILSILILVVAMIVFWYFANETRLESEDEESMKKKCKVICKDIYQICGTQNPTMYFLFLVVLFG